MPNAIKSKQDLAKHIELTKMEADAKKHTQALMELFNVMGTDRRDAAIKGMVDGMVREHRYIQQEFMSALQTALQQYAKSGSDARNIAGITWAKESGDLVPNIPFMS